MSIFSAKYIHRSYSEKHGIRSANILFKGKETNVEHLSNDIEMVVMTTNILAMKSKKHPLQYSRTRFRSGGDQATTSF
jgi:hypothetical protein